MEERKETRERGRTKVARDTVLSRLAGRGFPLATAERITERVLRSLAAREDPVVSTAELEEAIELQARASLIKAWRLGAPLFFQQAAPTPGPAAPAPAPGPWWGGPALSLGGEVIIQTSKWIGDDVPPKLHGISGVTFDRCCPEGELEKGFLATLKVDAEELDDWGWTGGIDRVTVGAKDTAGQRVGKTGQTSGDGFIGRKDFEVTLCIPCSAVHNARASVQITVEDGSGNSVSEAHTFPVDPDLYRRCC